MRRREFLIRAGAGLTLLGAPRIRMQAGTAATSSSSPLITLFLCGDVMTGRGTDQVLPHPSDPRIYESYLQSAAGYVELAETAHGRIPKPVDYSYPWGEALDALERHSPDVRIVNLETAVTRSDDFWPRKGINYRMHPQNVPCLSGAKIDCCALANNHVLDWGYGGLAETLGTLRRAGIRTAGAGVNREEAEEPTILEAPGKGRVIVLSFGSVTSGIPAEWAAGDDRPGVWLLEDLSDSTVGKIAARVEESRQPGDVVVASIHWGSNWGYRIPESQRSFAHRLVDLAGIDVVHGHSSHHPRGIEVYRERPILYGCGDFLNDYEGIGGYEEFRGELSLGYFVSVDSKTGRLARLVMTAFRIRHFRLEKAPRPDTGWLRETLSREGSKLGTRVEPLGESELVLDWDGAPDTS
jgi:poly-gamma-glutamate synthesis protein (capsule biosynthesis protein)